MSAVKLIPTENRFTSNIVFSSIWIVLIHCYLISSCAGSTVSPKYYLYVIKTSCGPPSCTIAVCEGHSRLSVMVTPFFTQVNCTVYKIWARPEKLGHKPARTKIEL